MASMDTLAQVMARRRKPPRRGGGPAYFIPGFGQQRTQRIQERSRPIAHDNSIPRWHSSHPIRKAPYRGRRRSGVSYD